MSLWADIRKTHLMQNSADGGQMTFNPKAFLDNRHKIDATPADQTGDIIGWSVFDNLRKFTSVFGCQFRGASRRFLLIRPSRPYSLKRMTQSRNVCRSINPIATASVRFLPSATAAKAINRGICPPSRTTAAKRCNSSPTMVIPHPDRSRHRTSSNQEKQLSENHKLDLLGIH